MPVRMKCPNCKSAITFANAHHAKGARCECGTTMRRVRKKNSDEIEAAAQQSAKRRVRAPREPEWNVVSDIAHYGMRAALGGLVIWFLAVVMLIATAGHATRVPLVISGFVLGLVFLVEGVCLIVMAASSFRIAGVKDAVVGLGTSSVPLVVVVSILLMVAPVVRQQQRKSDMKQILLAIHNFHDVHRAFPAPSNYDTEGKPLLSWRVHLLPYLDQKELYDQFHLDEPWDSPHNKELIGQIPKIYQADSAPKGQTGFLFVVGGQSVISGPPDREEDCRAGVGRHGFRLVPHEAIMLVEAPPDESVVWTQPADWDHTRERSFERLRSFRSEGVMVGNVNGLVRFIPPDADEADWKVNLPLVDKKRQ